MKTMVMIEQNK